MTISNCRVVSSAAFEDRFISAIIAPVPLLFPPGLGLFPRGLRLFPPGLGLFPRGLGLFPPPLGLSDDRPLHFPELPFEQSLEPYERLRVERALQTDFRPVHPRSFFRCERHA